MPSLDELFFSRLPVDDFTEYEKDLLYALQLLTEVMSKWFPRSISLQEWVDQRVPPDLAKSLNGSGIIFVEADLNACRRVEDLEQHHSKRRRTELIDIRPKGWKANAITHDEQKRKAGSNAGAHHAQQPHMASAYHSNIEAPNDMQASWARAARSHIQIASDQKSKGKGKNPTLRTPAPSNCSPSKEFIYEEILLRELVLHVVQRKNDQLKLMPTAADLHKLPRVNEAFLQAQKALQRTYQNVIEWIEDRASKFFSINFVKGEKALTANTCTEEMKLEQGMQREQLRDIFFNGLPDDSFTVEEETLRNTILDFLDNWTHNGNPTNQTMCQDVKVRDARYGCLPPTVSLMLWCERRMGGEICFEERDKGGHYVVRIS